jgi:hypothetical protein
MGNDLYWKITPPPPPDNEYKGSFYHSTWVELSVAMNVSDKDDMSGVILTEKHLFLLKDQYIKADRNNDNRYKEDLLELIDAINEHGSITLAVRG